MQRPCANGRARNFPPILLLQRLTLTLAQLSTEYVPNLQQNRDLLSCSFATPGMMRISHILFGFGLLFQYGSAQITFAPSAAPTAAPSYVQPVIELVVTGGTGRDGNFTAAPDLETGVIAKVMQLLQRF
jgi:hypothetical protein